MSSLRRPAHSGGTGGTWSHPWCAGPNSAIIQLLVGVRPLALGWSRFEFAPQPSSLAHVSASVPFVHGAVPGTIDVDVTQSATEVATTVAVPAGTTARVCLPPAHALSKVLRAAPAPAPAGKFTMRVNGSAVATVADGRLLCTEKDLAFGKYAVTLTYTTA